MEKGIIILSIIIFGPKNKDNCARIESFFNGFMQYVFMTNQEKKGSPARRHKEKGIYEGKVQKSGNGGRLTLPKEWVGKIVRVQLIDVNIPLDIEKVKPYIDDRLTENDRALNERIEELIVNFNLKLERSIDQLTQQIERNNEYINQQIEGQKEELMQFVVSQKLTIMDEMSSVKNKARDVATEPSAVIMDELKKTQEKLDEYNDIKQKIDRLVSLKKDYYRKPIDR